MSAIIHVEFPENTGGVARYTTSVKVEVASHNNPDRIVLTPDVYACSVGKTLKGEGKANVALVASRNYLNLLFPNDYVNIYFDIGDGEGWTRAFMGLVDRVEEEFQVGNDGQPTTSYHLIATDYTKVFTKVQVYFNPSVANRPDIRGSDFSQGNIGGITVLSRGVNVSGSPAEVVQNYILVMLGFGSQMVLPTSYRPHTSDQFRNSQRDFILERFESPNLSRLVDTETIDALRTRLNQDSPAQTEEPPRDLEELSTLANATPDEIVGAYNVDEIQARILSQVALRRIAPGADRPSFLLDVLDLYSFVENLAIDGRSDVLTVLDSQGDIMSVLRSLTNEVVNEMFFDLRAVKSDGSMTPGSDFSRDPDDWGGNAAGDGHPAGVQYVPAVVMREYPFSTIDSVDATNVAVTLAGSGSEALYGMMTFGAIFSNEPNRAGRHVIRIPSVAVSDQVEGQAQHLANKHLDVAVLHENEITATRLGRSDEDHFNVFELLSNSLVGNSDERQFLVDLLPLFSPIHIMRHGLRLKQADTRYVYFGNGAVVSRQMQGQPAEEPEEEVVEERTLRADVEAPIRQADAPGYNLTYQNSGARAYGYRLGPPGRTVADALYWHFHNGIDIATTGSVPVDAASVTQRLIPVRAIADGEVVVSAPNGVYNKYGECVVIRHPQIQHNGRAILSGYHHLAGRNVSMVGNEGNHSAKQDCSALGANCRFRPRPVQKGDIIGWMGNTFGTPSAPNAVFAGKSRPHLHFEIDYVFPPKGTPGNGGPQDHACTQEVYDLSHGPAASRPANIPANLGTVVPATTTPEVRTPLSVDPYAFLLSNGVDLVNLYSATPTEEIADDAEGTEEARPEREEEQTEQEQSQRSTTSGDAQVDNIVIRNVLARWTLLQDHWYQHNLEYLSGTITCRPAPEIRVGYRLDIPERSMSFYVEGVQHSWQMGGKMSTTLQVTRGQPNNPYPVYVLPPTRGLSDPATQRRNADSRLAKFTMISDPVAVRRALVMRAQGVSAQEAQARSAALISSNQVDIDAAESDVETVIPAEMTDVMAGAITTSTEPLELADTLAALDENPLTSQGGVQELDPTADFSDDELDRMYDDYGGDA